MVAKHLSARSAAAPAAGDALPAQTAAPAAPTRDRISATLGVTGVLVTLGIVATWAAVLIGTRLGWLVGLDVIGWILAPAALLGLGTALGTYRRLRPDLPGWSPSCAWCWSIAVAPGGRPCWRSRH